MLAYYINLARRTDRRAAMEAQLAQLGLAGERIDAVEAADLPDALRKKYLPNGRHQRLSVPEFCVGVSHLEAYRRLLAGPDAYALVLEDDIVLSRRLSGLLQLFNDAPHGIDLLRLETFGSPAQISTQARDWLGDFAGHSLHGWTWGSAAYVISRRAAKAMLDNGRALDEVIDRVLYRPHGSIMGKIKRRQLVPALAIQQDRMPGHVWGAGSDLAAARGATRPLGQRPSLVKTVSAFIEAEIRIALPSALHRLLGLSRRCDIEFLAD